MSDDDANEQWVGFSWVEPAAAWLPRTARDQSCAACGAASVRWLHPLAPDRVLFRAFDKGHTLPTFWALCDHCESLYAEGEDEALLDRMFRQANDEGDVPDEGALELIRKSLTAFRDADLGARKFADSPLQ